MLENGQYWRTRNLRQHVAVVDEELLPTMVFKNATYLNVYTKKWIDANIWIYEDRIVYVGDKMPVNLEGVEWYDCTGQYFVPGYIEPHAHPFQVYNPEEIANYSGQYGTTTLINDNLALLYLLDNTKAFELIEDMHQLPVSMFWWARYDSQTLLSEEDKVFNSKNILSWVEHPSVIQGGELTNWVKLLGGSDQILYWMQETLKKGKRVEGHLPGASSKTLTKLKLLGVSADHEAMTAEEVLRRLELGYHTALRYSSIHPDLPEILKALISSDFKAFDQLMFTTDGSTPAFCEHGLINVCLDIAIKSGVPIEEAYRMASYNVAKYYGIDGFVGGIAPGRIANLNMLYEKDDPHPLGVIAKGKWIVKDGIAVNNKQTIDWEHYGLGKLEMNWELEEDDFQYSIPIGLQLENDVIMKPYAVDVDITLDHLPDHHDIAFLNFIDKKGKWRVNTVIKGFTQKLGGLCSSYSTTGDIILIGKNKTDIKLAFNRMKEIGGGIVLVHAGEVIFELPLSISGAMYQGDMRELIKQEKTYRKIIQEAGYRFDDPLYSLLFLCATHLPFIRVTQLGIVDVMQQEVIVPANMR